MFTDKEAKKFNKLFEDKTEPKDRSECRSITQLIKYFPDFLENILKDKFDGDITDLSNIVFPEWIPEIAQKQVKEHIETVEKHKDDKVCELLGDFYGTEILRTVKLLPVFINFSMKDMWQELSKVQSEKIKDFVSFLFGIDSDFNMALNMYDKHKNEKKCFKKILLKIKETKDLMEEYQCHFYGHMITDEFIQLQKDIEEFNTVSLKELATFEEQTKDISYLFTDLAPVTREYKAKKSLPVFYIRKLLLFFETEFGKPYYEYVAEIISAIFDEAYDINTIIKNFKPVKHFIKGENSTK